MDASVGLEFSLRLFQRYHKSGLLRAQVRHVPGVQGVCIACVHVSNGTVTDSYVENRHAQRYPLSVDVLCNLDNQRGPFEWIFQEDAKPSTPLVSASPASVREESAQPFPDTFIPRAVAPLPLEKFAHWTPVQKQMLQHVWNVVNGRRTIREIKAGLPLAPQAINEILRILQALQVIVFMSR